MVRKAAAADPAKALLGLEALAEEKSFAGAALYQSRRDRIYYDAMRGWAKRDLEKARAFADGIVNP
jgi:hypothetical protein